MKYKQSAINITLTILTAIFVISCAIVSPPEGGPKDVKPPDVLYSVPPNASANFKDKKIKIRFSEFIQIKDIGTQLLISPPMDEIPVIGVKGKWLVIKLPKNLKDSTTYSMFFGNAIVDFSEGNPMSNYRYVFATGNRIDSCEISGKVINAYTLKPEKDVFVMLYKRNIDSLPLKKRPVYVCKTSDNGDFIFKNIALAAYKIFALKDVNSNYLYDMPNEEIAFSDSMQMSIDENQRVKDTTKVKKTVPEHLSSTSGLLLFTENDTVQKLMTASNTHKNEYTFSFKVPVKNPELLPADTGVWDNWYMKELNPSRDTLKVWFINIHTPFFKLLVTDNGKFLDTVLISLGSEKKEKTLSKLKKTKSNFIFSSNAKPTFDYYEHLRLKSAFPLSRAKLSELRLVEEKDTLKQSPAFIDSVRRTLEFKYKLKPNTSYRLFIPDSCFEDIYHQFNDTIQLNFKTNNPENFGTLVVNFKVKDTGPDYLVQLITENNDIVSKRTIRENTAFKFEHLKPGKYFLKTIIDSNKNGKWDTGNYLHHRQPEKIVIRQAVIEIKENWDQEVEWEF